MIQIKINTNIFFNQNKQLIMYSKIYFKVYKYFKDQYGNIK